MADVFDAIGGWLLDRAIEDADLPDTMSEFGSRLIDAGVPLGRIVMGRGLAHPVIGLASLIWQSDQDHVTIEVTPPSLLSREEVLATPFGHMALTGTTKMSALLTDPEQVE